MANRSGVGKPLHYGVAFVTRNEMHVVSHNLEAGIPFMFLFDYYV